MRSITLTEFDDGTLKVHTSFSLDAGGKMMNFDTDDLSREDATRRVKQWLKHKDTRPWVTKLKAKVWHMLFRKIERGQCVPYGWGAVCPDPTSFAMIIARIPFNLIVYAGYRFWMWALHLGAKDYPRICDNCKKGEQS